MLSQAFLCLCRFLASTRIHVPILWSSPHLGVQCGVDSECLLWVTLALPPVFLWRLLRWRFQVHLYSTSTLSDPVATLLLLGHPSYITCDKALRIGSLVASSWIVSRFVWPKFIMSKWMFSTCTSNGTSACPARSCFFQACRQFPCHNLEASLRDVAVLAVHSSMVSSRSFPEVYDLWRL